MPLSFQGSAALSSAVPWKLSTVLLTIPTAYLALFVNSFLENHHLAVPATAYSAADLHSVVSAFRSLPVSWVVVDGATVVL